MDPAEAELDQVVKERAQRLFLLSDVERKGFIVRRDMQRMRAEMPLTPEQLEAVFDSLDVDGNGYLTLDQFLAGFGDFLRAQRRPPSRDSQLRSLDEADSGVGMPSVRRPDGDGGGLDRDEEEEDGDDVEDAEQDPLDVLLDQIEDTHMLSSTEALRQLVQRVRRDAGPLVHANLERFLMQLNIDLGRRLEDARQMETALKARDEAHHKQMQKLFEEMEAQLSEDKENIVRQEERRLRLSQTTLREQLRQRDEQLQEALSAQQQLAEGSDRLRRENAQLQRRQEELERRLEMQQEETARLQQTVEGSKRHSAHQRQRQLTTGFQLAWALLLEHQGLLQQLQMVRSMADTLTNLRNFTSEHTKQENHVPPKATASFSRQTSFSNSRSQQTSMFSTGSLDDYEYDEEFYTFPTEKFEMEEPYHYSSFRSSNVDKVVINTTSLQDEIALSLQEKGSPWSSPENGDTKNVPSYSSAGSLCNLYSVLSRGYDIGHLFTFPYNEFCLLPFVVRYFCLGTILKYTTCIVVAYIFMLILKFKCDAT